MHTRKSRLVAVTPNDVDQFDRIGHEPLPTVGLCHFPRVTLVETHAFKYQRTGGFDTLDQSQAPRIRRDHRTGNCEQAGIPVHFSAIQQFGQRLHFQQ